MKVRLAENSETRTSAATWPALLLFALASIFMLGRAESKEAPPDSCRVLDLTGASHMPLVESVGALTVFVFIMHDCPICNGYAPEINRIISEYSKQGVRFYLIYTESDLSLADAKEHSAAYAYAQVAMLDTKHELVHALKVNVAPEVVLRTASGTIAYRGRLDDTYSSFGKHRQSAVRHDLRIALNEMLAGKRIFIAETEPVGCFITDAN